MPQTPPVKMTITLSIDANIWLDYRTACHAHTVKPSHEVEAFMKQQLAAWQPQPQKEPDHA